MLESTPTPQLATQTTVCAATPLPSLAPGHRWTIRPALPCRLSEAGTDRPAVLAFIQAEFQRHYGAVLEDDTPDLYQVRDAEGQLVAAFGIRQQPADFFSRHYVGDVVARMRVAFGDTVDSGNLVELTHLSLRNPAIMCLLGPLITEYWLAREKQYLVCTAIAPLYRFFIRHRFQPVILGSADEARLPANLRGTWGSYYAHQPRVLGGGLFRRPPHRETA